MQKMVRYVFALLLGLFAVAPNAQLEWTRVGIVCPCRLESEDGTSVTLQFGVSNFENYPTESLWATVAVTGYFEDEAYSDTKSLYLGTAPLNFGLSELEEVEQGTYEVELGQLPAGQVYIELLIHEGRRITFHSLLDSIWFEGETEMPFTSLSKREMDFLRDTDGDGVGDVNETFMETDPNDAADVPSRPEIDVLVAYNSDIQDVLPGDDANAQISHIFAITNLLFERSGSPLHFRVVGTLADHEITEIDDEYSVFARPDLRDELQEEYGADLIVVFHPGETGLCGIAEDIAGWRGRGFIHPLDRAILTHVWLNPAICPVNVTAHEIGHLMGLGHSYVQGAIGTFYWSRGHGEHDEFGTVMSYAESAYNGIDIDKFSNPEEDCNGKPCGIAHTLSNHEKSADSALTVNITKYQVASTGTPPSNLDVDGDGYAADEDQFPLDASEWIDTDGDGYGDNMDAFPDLATEWADFDGDGIGDNSDPDIDDDGILNHNDADPFNAEVSTVRILHVVSQQSSDSFGTKVVHTDDWDSDGVEDIAISAPSTMDSEGVRVGGVYLVSKANLMDNSPDSDSNRSLRDVDQLVSEGHGWTIFGDEADGDLGFSMASGSADPDNGASGNLLISSDQFVYLLQVDEATLNSFDEKDGVADRNIHVEHCGDTSGCWRIGQNNDLEIRAIVGMEDRDDDGLSDFAVLGVRSDADDISVYLLTVLGLQSYEHGTSAQSNALDQIVSDVVTCFRVEADTGGNYVSLANLGNLTGFIGDELGVGIGGIRGLNDDAVYVLNTELVHLVDMNDENSDGQVEIEDFLDDALGSYKIVMPGRDSLGIGIDSIKDLDDDDRPEVMMWSEWDPHVLLTGEGFETLDESDGSIDGHISLDDTSSEYSGVYYFNNVHARERASQTVLNSATDGHESFILSQIRSDVLLFGLGDLESLDHPESDQRNGEIDVRGLLGNPGVTLLQVPLGLRPGISFSGMTVIGDLDLDEKLDFIFASHTQREDRQIESDLHVVFSDSISTIDKADGIQDGILRLHNNMEDTDGDGIANLRDMDDDNDGATDSYDAYPLLSQAIYDADGDGTANVIDAFPNDPYEDSDFDGDGFGDQLDEDLDGDGIENFLDDFPMDTDNDGLDNDADLDDDGDGVEDTLDAFPLNPDEQYDTDGDGVGDNADLFVNDQDEWEDFDMDGIGDNGDSDDDNDGHDDDIDQFPFDSSEWRDSDGDGVGDNADPFPDNPFEWEDSDSDGLGDNLENAAIATHRIESEWIEFDPYFGLQQPSAYHLGNFDLQGGSKLLIHGGTPNEPQGALQLLSSTDLDQLETLDDQTNQTLQFSDIAQGAQSWEFRGPRTVELLHENYGAVTDVDSDSIGDLIISSPFDTYGSGAIYVVRGSQLAEADNIDGSADGKINHTQCSVNGLCIAILGSGENYFGFSTTSLNGAFGEGDAALVVSNFYATELPDGEEGGVPMFYLISNSAIAREQEELQDDELQLGQLLEQDGALEVFSEFPEHEASPQSPVVSQLADFDNDNAEDLLVSMSYASKTYFLSSIDLLNADSDDGSEDGRVNLVHVVDKPNSYRLEDFLPLASAARSTLWGSVSETTQFVALSPGGSFDEHYLLDVSDLAKHDESDGIVDGIISDIEIADSNSWLIQGVEDVEICNGGKDDANSSLIAFRDTLENYNFHWFSMGALRSVAAETGATENVVNIPDAISNDADGIYTIGFGSLEEDLWDVQVSCMGDWDNDGEEDLAVSLYHEQYLSFYEGLAKSTIFLLMTSDLEALDTLDGTKDSQVDLSLLWRSTSGD